MGRTLYLECASGISGDMVVAALLDLGAGEEGLRKMLASLPLSGYEVKVSRTKVRALDACDFDVVLEGELAGQDHDMDYLYGHLADGGHGVLPAEIHEHHHHGHGHGEHCHDHEHGHDEHHHEHHHDHGEHGHDHEHHHDHGYHHGHVHRGLSDVLAVLSQGSLSPSAYGLAEKIFRVLAQAEAQAHGTTVEDVHFHEVGAVDAIVDVASAAYLIDSLDVDDVVVSPLAEGEGTVRAAHGILPVPVPAVVNIVAASGLALAPAHRPGELVTPTGAAIAAAVKTRDALPAAFCVKAVGLGAGKRAYDPPSFVRALLLEDAGNVVAPVQPASSFPDLWKLECEVDDCTGEALGCCVEKLYGAGVREAHYLPVFMKKGRPGYQLEVLVDEAGIAGAEQVIFETTTTIGIRRSPLWRTTLEREAVRVQTPLGAVSAKRVTLPGGALRTYPEYESVRNLAGDAGTPFQEAYRAALAACVAADAGAEEGSSQDT